MAGSRYAIMTLIVIALIALMAMVVTAMITMRARTGPTDAAALRVMLWVLGRARNGRLVVRDRSTSALLVDTGRSSSIRRRIASVIGRMDLLDVGGTAAAAVYDGEVGLGEAYVAGMWTSPDLVSLMMVLIANRELVTLGPGKTIAARKHGEMDAEPANVDHHYSVGNDFYATFLTDELMAYTCGVWPEFGCGEEGTLQRAQDDKVAIVAAKLGAKPGERVLDIGCGWGRVAARVGELSGGCEMHGVTLSKEQHRQIEDEGRLSRCWLANYVDLPGLGARGAFDRVFSIGMVEQVGCPSFDEFFGTVRDLLSPTGPRRFVLHTITQSDGTPGGGERRCDRVAWTFIAKHIFPGGQLPTREQLLVAAAGAGFRLAHLEVYGGQHYARTLRAWRASLLAARARIVTDLGYDDALVRRYDYYFAQCEALFWLDGANVTHFVFQLADSLECSPLQISRGAPL